MCLWAPGYLSPSPLASNIARSTAVRKAECVSLSLPVHSLSAVGPMQCLLRVFGDTICWLVAWSPSMGIKNGKVSWKVGAWSFSTKIRRKNCIKQPCIFQFCQFLTWCKTITFSFERTFFGWGGRGGGAHTFFSPNGNPQIRGQFPCLQ